MHRNRFESLSFFALFAVVAALLFFVFAPFVQILTLAAVFAVLFQPLYQRLARELGGWKSVAALLTVAMVLVFLIVPLFFLGSQIFTEAQGLYAGGRYLQALQTIVEGPVRHFVPSFSFDINAYVGNLLTFISNNLASLVSQTFYVILDTFLMLLAFFFFLRDGRDLVGAIADVSPFGGAETAEILGKMYQTTRSIVKGTLLAALIRLVLNGVGFYLFGVPNASLWSLIGGVVGAIPGLGTPFAFIPAVA